MHHALAVLVIAEGFQRQWKQERFLFRKDGRDLAFGGAMNAGVGPTLLLAIQIGLGFCQALEAQALERRYLRVADAGFDLAFVRLLDPKTGQLLREHVRQKRGWHRIKPEDHSKRTPLRTSQLLWRAGRAGTHIGALCEAIHRQHGEVGVRRILGVLSLAKKYGAAAVDEACTAALEMGVQEYRFVRRYLERCPQAPLSLQQVDPLIRELVQYRDLINHRTKEVEP
jgi:hypothetical protein